MDNKTLRDEFRRQLTNVHALTVSTISLFEIIGYIVLVLSGVERFSFTNAYLWYGVVFPIVINVITHFVARAIVNNPSVSRKRQNLSIIVAALVTSFVVAVIHKEYIVSSCAFIFPMVLSAMFNDRKLLDTSLLVSLFILFCVGVAFWVDKTMTLTAALNLFVLFGFAWISYLCGIISVNFSRQNYTTIEFQAEQNDKLKEDALKDQMTGLYNHSTFVNKLDEVIDHYLPNESICLVIADVDDFKQINDTFGHGCGDMVLAHLAKILQKHCGTQGTAYRYGGEEFALIFKGVDEAATCSIVQAMLKEFREHVFSFAEGTITFSAGVCGFVQGTTRDEFFESADKTLYRAKREGKNRVLIAKGPVSA